MIKNNYFKWKFSTHDGDDGNTIKLSVSIDFIKIFLPLHSAYLSMFTGLFVILTVVDIFF